MSRTAPLLLALVAGVLAGCGGPEPATTESAFTLAGSGTTVGTADTELGRILVGPDDRTLYRFDADGPCADACATQFPPFLAEGVPAPADATLTAVDVSELGTVAVTGGQQVTYGGVPLHFYRGDGSAGSVAGQELALFGGTFHAVGPGGTTIVR